MSRTEFTRGAAKDIQENRRAELVKPITEKSPKNVISGQQVEYETTTARIGGGVTGRDSSVDWDAVQRRSDARAARQRLAANEQAGNVPNQGRSTANSSVTDTDSNFSAGVIGVLGSTASNVSSADTNATGVLRQASITAGDTSGFKENMSLDVTGDTKQATMMTEGPSSIPVKQRGASRSRIPNPLRNHNHYNYIITLGILNPQEYNNPMSYRNRGEFASHIIKSSGGGYAKRYRVLDEVGSQGSSNAEYYLDDLDLDAVIAPNKNTGVALGTTLSFKVTEPFSMGNFIQAIIGSAKEQGYQNYIDAPFCLKIDFVGWDEYGERSEKYVTPPVFMPVKITKVELSVTTSGSEYIVYAVPYSEIGLSDDANTSRTPINAVGTSVWQILNGEDRSVSSTLNQRLENLEDKGVTTQNDRYIVAFPRDLTGFKDAISGSSPSEESTYTSADQIQRELGLTIRPGQDSDKQENLEKVVVKPKSDLFRLLQLYARDESKMNPIGRSPILIETSEGGDQAHTDQNVAYDEVTQVITYGEGGVQSSEKAREHKFNEGETIVSMIESVILRSQYVAESAVADSNTNGTRNWFKIDTQVYIDPEISAEAQRGVSAKIYVYSVIPYYPDEAKTLGTNQRPNTTDQLKSQAAKEYNYIYTGVNEDVLDFELLFNNSFMITAFSNYGQNNAGAGISNSSVNNGSSSTPAGTSIAAQTPNASNTEPGALINDSQTTSRGDAARSSDPRLRIAQQFHDSIVNQHVDMVTAEMKIMGDPFFLPQQTGNFSGTPTNRPNVLEEGTVNYMQDEVFVVINFRTPFDYQVQGATMEFPRVVTQFSGLFSVWAVTNNFSGGKFEQTIKLIRRRGQDDPATANNAGSVELSDNAVLANTSQDAARDSRPDQSPNSISNETTAVEGPSWARTGEATVLATSAKDAGIIVNADGRVLDTGNGVFSNPATGESPVNRKSQVDDQKKLVDSIQRSNAINSQNRR